MTRRLQAVLLPICLFVIAACGAADAARQAGETGRVISVDSPMTLKLETGLTVRLAGVAAPEEVAEREASRAALKALAEGETVFMRAGGSARDRYGRAVAQLYIAVEPEPWAQGEMVRGGWLLAESVAGDSGDARALQALEAEARRAGRGHWGSGAFIVRAPDTNGLAQHLDTFQIVEGIVVETAEVREWTYLNFGLDYRTDFTVAIHEDSLARFEGTGIDPAALSGARLRVRGWVEPRNGPMITVDHPEQIEILD